MNVAIENLQATACGAAKTELIASRAYTLEYMARHDDDNVVFAYLGVDYPFQAFLLIVCAAQYEVINSTLEQLGVGQYVTNMFFRQYVTNM